MKNLLKNVDAITTCYNGDDLIEKLFIFVKDEIKYKFGDWRIASEIVLNIGHGMCTTKSRLLYDLLKKQGFNVYFRVLRINAQSVFGRFTLPEISKYLSENSVHFYVVVDIRGKLVELDCSLDNNLEKKLKYFGYIIDNNWFLPKNYINFIENSDIIKRGDLVNNIDYYINKKITIKNKIKFFISNICLNYIRVCDVDDLRSGRVEKRKFLNWLKKRNFIYYIFFLILISIKK